MKLLSKDATDHEKSYFYDEMRLMAGLKYHPYVVKFAGQVSVTWPLMIVMEYCINGNLRDYLRKVFMSLMISTNYQLTTSICLVA